MKLQHVTSLVQGVSADVRMMDAKLRWAHSEEGLTLNSMSDVLWREEDL